ncbi:hypothetical protein R1sor_000701 [Riccia sorocarpa]|uniref:Reverse transcriptase domain-containing protein n=1 Tax=Riccia sorocarpa TaxID=122646 RepID=A0ABD3GWD4_9MARC
MESAAPGSYTRERYLKEGDACTAYFFTKFKIRKKKSSLDHLLLEDGSTITDQESIKREVLSNFQELYGQPRPPEEDVALRKDLLDNLGSRVSREQQLLLDDESSEGELRDLLKLIPSGKSPGLDGIGIEIIAALWPSIGRLFSLAVLDYWRSGQLHSYFKDGILFLIPKVNNPTTLAQWRPITILNTIYKIIAKLLAVRLALILPSIVPENQQGFVKGSTTQNCILTFALTHEALKKSRKSACFLSLDLEKAFDKLDQDFLWEVLLKLDFSQGFISRVQALLHDAETRILINGDLLPAFTVGRGVRQGCPLSPLLFALASVPLIHLLRHQNNIGAIKPVKLDNNLVLSCVCLADDTAVYTEMNETSVRNVFSAFSLLGRASGEKINVSKSRLLLIGRKLNPPPWLFSLGVQIVPPDQTTRYLGAQLVTLSRGVDNGFHIRASITKKAQASSSPLLPFESRTIALKHAIFAPTVYCMLTSKLKMGTLKEIDSILRDFIWAKGVGGRKGKAFVAWDQIVLPRQMGGLGIFELLLFQQSLLCRSIYRAALSPTESIWGRIFFTFFLHLKPEELPQGLFMKPLQFSFSACPVATLLLHSWQALAEKITWQPEERIVLPNGSIFDSAFLAARMLTGPKKAALLADSLARLGASSGATTVTQLLSSPPVIHYCSNTSNNSLRNVLLLLRSADLSQDTFNFLPAEWRFYDGSHFPPDCSGSLVYLKLISDRLPHQISKAKTKWGLSWEQVRWTNVWSVYNLNRLPERHRIFLWRVLSKALYDGRKEFLFG